MASLPYGEQVVPRSIAPYEAEPTRYRIIATLGPRSTAKRVSRKQIQEVDVPKACETILEPPGAPIALRLQGSLLYGVSRVFDQQCTYVLTDVEKIHEQMRTFKGILGARDNAIDPNAGKAK
jgi:meiotic recombination protein REC8